MTRLQILQNELSRLNTEVLTDTGFVLRNKLNRITLITAVLARELLANGSSGGGAPVDATLLNAKFDKSNVLDLQWLSQHELTPEQLSGKVFDALIVKSLSDANKLPTPFYQSILYGQPSERINPVTEEPYLEFQLINIEDALYQCGWEKVSMYGTPLALTRTTEQINAMPTYPGMLVFNSTLDTLCFRGVSGWRKLTSSAM